MKDVNLALQTWLDQWGFRFDPFLPLDASLDPHLSEYRVDHDTFEAVWGDWMSFVFAPPGGGKTAFRVNAAQLCWIGQGTNRPFPITYLPSHLDQGGTEFSWFDHLAGLSGAAARQLLLALAYRPHWLFNLDVSDQRQVRQAFDWNLPGPLPYYLAQCQSNASLHPLSEAFDPTFQLADPPDAATLGRFCDLLLAFPSSRNTRPGPAERWQHLTGLLLDILKFEFLYALIDGLDAVLETGADPQAAVNSVSALLDHAAEWSRQRIYVKGFFPSDTRAIFETRHRDLALISRLVTIQWTPVLLAEIVRKRLDIATDGAFNSLNAVGSPALPTNVELELAQLAPPLPREMLVLTREVLKAHAVRTNGGSVLEPEDIDLALALYRR